MTGYADYRGVELYVTFSARGELSDCGVPGSPTWTEWVDVKVESLSILDVDVDFRQLPTALVNAILSLADEVEFHEEDDYDGPDRMDEE